MDRRDWAAGCWAGAMVEGLGAIADALGAIVDALGAIVDALGGPMDGLGTDVEGLMALGGPRVSRSSSLESPAAADVSAAGDATCWVEGFLGLGMTEPLGLRMEGCWGCAAASAGSELFGGMARPEARGGRMLRRGAGSPPVPAIPAASCRAEGDVFRNVESRLGDRSKSSSLDSALGPSCFVGVLGAAPLKLGLVGDAMGAREGIVDFRASAVEPLSCIRVRSMQPHQRLQPPLAAYGWCPDHCRQRQEG